MKTVQIIGAGCAKCAKLAENVREAIEQTGVEVRVEKVQDLDQIVSMGVTLTPALAVDGQILLAGRIATVEEIARWLREGSSAG